MRRPTYLVLITLLIASFTYPQRRHPGDDPPPPKPKPPVVIVPPRKPRVPTNGVLSVVTTPAIANVVIKDKRGTVIKEGQSKQGIYQMELSPGEYTIEVSADRFLPDSFQKEVQGAKSAVVQAQLAPAFGSILISLGSVGPDATILIDGQKPARLTGKAENRIQIDDVPAGSHTLRITHPSIADYQETIEVVGGMPAPVTPVFRPALVNLIVRSEPGAKIYVDGMIEGQVETNGELRIPGKYKPGRHTIRAENERGRFEPAEKTEDFKIGDRIVELNLNRIKPSPEFSENFQSGTSFWDAPKAWQVKSGKLFVKDSEVGLRSGVYADFKMIFDISFNNQKGAAWIVRARDKKNYYIFQLSGPKAASPRLFQSYMSQDGQLKHLNSERVVEDLSRPDDSYTITIEAKGPTIRHFIQLKSNPARGSELFSTLTDSTFSYGAIGFGTIDGEEFVVYFVNVVSDESKSR